MLEASRSVWLYISPIDNRPSNRRSLTQSNCWKLAPHEEHGIVDAADAKIPLRPLNMGSVFGQISYILFHCQARIE